jgi:hypothetical protein
MVGALGKLVAHGIVEIKKLNPVEQPEKNLRKVLILK